MTEDNKISPKSKFQEDYLKSNARILVVGGGAGSSKSYVGLMRHLRWVHDPLYRGYCIRKNSTAIMKSGGLFQQACALYMKYDPKIKIKLKDQKIVFSSGAEVTFSHYENNNAAQLYQGLAMSGIFFDEATHSEEENIWWLVSRLRTEANMNPMIWLSCNPDPDSYLFDWVKWWLYPETSPNYGLPDPDRNGKIRWLVRRDGILYWGDSREEMVERYGEKSLPISFQVLLGTIYSNPTLLENQPEYLSSLESLPDIERRRLLLGDWTARQQDSTHFLRTWVREEIQEPHPSEIIKTVRAYDLAGSLKSDSSPSPDYTACCKMSKLKDGTYFIHDMQRTRIRFGEWEAFILKNAYQDGVHVEVLIPEDPNPAAKAASKMLCIKIASQGFYAQTMRSSTSKLDRFRPFSSVALNSGVAFLKNCGTDHENKIYNDLGFVYKELEGFTGARRNGESGHDDLVDSISDAFSALARSIHIPDFSHGLSSLNLSSNNHFNKI